MACNQRPQHLPSEPQLAAAAVTEFLGTLTPREQAFYHDYLVAEPESAVATQYSSANVWQLTHRVYQKMLKFFTQSE